MASIGYNVTLRQQITAPLLSINKQFAFGGDLGYIPAGQIFLMDKFLGGIFLTFGLDVIRFMEDNQEIHAEPMIVVFPRMD